MKVIDLSTMDSRTSNFFETLAEFFSSLERVIKEIGEYVSAHPEIVFVIQLEVGYWNHLVVKYYNGLKRRSNDPIEKSDAIELIFLNIDTKREHKEKFYSCIGQTIPEWNYGLCRSTFSISIFESSITAITETEKDLSSFEKKALFRCNCTHKQYAGALSNYPINETRVKRIIEVSKKGYWDGYCQGYNDKVFLVCKGHLKCDFDNGNCQGNYLAVTTYIDDHSQLPYGRQHGAIYCEKHSPPGFKTGMWNMDSF